jgi:hypothetical protein
VDEVQRIRLERWIGMQLRQDLRAMARAGTGATLGRTRPGP